jgi:hypothetical protein
MVLASHAQTQPFPQDTQELDAWVRADRSEILAGGTEAQDRFTAGVVGGGVNTLTATSLAKRVSLAR